MICGSQMRFRFAYFEFLILIVVNDAFFTASKTVIRSWTDAVDLGEIIAVVTPVWRKFVIALSILKCVVLWPLIEIPPFKTVINAPRPEGSVLELDGRLIFFVF